MPSLPKDFAVRPEHSLLLAASRTRISAETASSLQNLTRQYLDWNYFNSLVNRHFVGPLVYHQLQKFAGETIPPEMRQLFKTGFQQNAARNVLLAQELCRLVRLLAQADVEAIAFKGPVLAVKVYGELILRKFVDLDIMVLKKDVPRARDLLISEGYQLSGGLTQGQQNILLHSQHNLQFCREEGRLVIELHWEVASDLFASSVKAEDLWKRVESVSLYGTTIKSLGPNDLLFSLCVHGSRHLWERLAWIVDVAELLSGPHNLDWPLLTQRAADCDAERMLQLGLYLAADLLDAPLPADVRERIEEDRSLKGLASQINARLFNESVFIPVTVKQMFTYNLAVRKSWRSRAKYCLYTLAPTDSDLRVSLPRQLAFVYYLMRPLRMLWKGPAAAKPLN